MSRSLESRLERLEQIKAQTAHDAPAEIHIFGVDRNDDGEWVEDEQPCIVFHVNVTFRDQPCATLNPVCSVWSRQLLRKTPVLGRPGC
ncbi:conserved hypothetical protein [Thiomonas sp. CB2]|nr:conserved hypothetical protein [Thiomonas sp. CB2]VDY03286.1 conserved protein of unknown function [Thiomonas sp. Bio17B3]VDY09539.1 conserved protein of unknown function [Thiomonas sp. Sup16B3]VDY11536.1 conserved protein of unknown function [Thiomonas sp. OC7]VDY19251.1 conserved protein of unknown function [Thiomonas sp. CB2]